MKHYGKIALLMAGIVAVSALVTVFTGTVGVAKTDTVVTTTYPLYLAARNALMDVPGVTVVNLTGSATGCLHDYQLSPADRILLESATAVLTNGGGAEEFLDGVEFSAPVYSTAKFVNFLDGCHHHDDDHDHDEEHDHALNEHIWASPARYAAQAANVGQALATAFPQHREAILRDGSAYHKRVVAIAEEMAALKERLQGTPCVTFHDSLAYLADDLGLTVVATLTVGEESGVSASDLAAAQQAVEQNSATLVLYDDQYTVRYATVDGAAAPGHVLALNTGVRGKGAPDDWLAAMTDNLKLLKTLTEATA